MYRILSTILISAAVLSTGSPARGESNGPSTLLRWSYGKPSDEGSNLDQPLETDRPDFTQSPATVGQGVFQLESGYTFTYDNGHGVRTADHSFPETLYRLGVGADWFELRAYWNYEVQRTTTGGSSDSQSGADDLVLGMKIALRRAADRKLPELLFVKTLKAVRLL